MRKGLNRWANQIRHSRKIKKERLTARLVELLESDRDDENLAELIYTKIQLNFEIEKDERETKEIHEMEAIARSYYQNLFSTGRWGNYEHLLTGIDRCIFEEDNSRLTARYTKEEIQEALSELGPTKAPGEDGFSALFYQKCWSIFGEDVSSFCLKHLNEEDGEKGYMVVKLDMSKAYDRVEWNFIAAIMKRMGFNSGWVESLMKYVSTVSYSVVFNGHIGENFQPTRGLRQGDPLSPFLFLICREGLSSLMRLAIQGNILRGVKASRSGPQVSHLLFADDSILFGEATERGAPSLKQILIEYENCSGQCVNYDKYIVFFSTNTQEGDKAVVSRVLGVRSSNNPERYLGLPNMSVLAAKGILEKGLCWRIGTGGHISVWDDLWIPGTENDRLQNETTNEDIKLVSDLIDANNRKWKTGLVLSTFNKDTAKKILQIPLSETIYEDFQAWRGEPSGEHSVRSLLLQTITRN
ncbi:reverse transcriptase [Gossypium australe]|uniref:Reverse transcriptase n=1 Tax=Gossypium australe TaxID=47621 RepID=A0A5B6W0K5_9ROSI|nr:reverse transcriptase [Gossypium australe]